MSRVYLIHREQRIELPDGHSIIGRGLDCDLRFNDSAISRRHLRIFNGRGGVSVENLSKTNGTRLNGLQVEGIRDLSSGDRLELGNRKLLVQIDDVSAAPVQGSGGAGHEVAPGLLLSDHDDDEPEEHTRPGQSPLGMLAALEFDERNCPKCRRLCSSDSDECPGCGYLWPQGRPGATTQEIDLGAFRARQAQEYVQRAFQRYEVRVPVLYSSEYLTLDATARDLSEGGMFIASGLLDPVGTPAQVTVLPDGAAALTFRCSVCHVSTELVNGRPPGFGVSFDALDEQARQWVLSVLSRAQ